MTDLPARDLALTLAHVLDEKSGEDIQVLKLPKGQLCDFVIVVTGRSDRQVRSLADEVRSWCKDQAIDSRPVEGESGWLLVDCIDVVVHALTQEMRDYYRLERLWGEATPIEWQSDTAAKAKAKAKRS